jgi:maleylacetate reductase
MNTAQSLPHAGTFHVTAHERVVFGMSAEEAVLAEVERCGARRVLLTSTRSLTRLESGPLQRLEKALGPRRAGTFAAIRSHSPREDVVAGANAARESKADLIVAVGGGSVIDATKAMLLCLWHNVNTPEAMEPYRSGFDRGYNSAIVPPAEPVRMVSVSTTLSAANSRSGTACSPHAASSSIPLRLSIRRTGSCSAPASGPSTMPWRPTAAHVRILSPRRCRCWD